MANQIRFKRASGSDPGASDLVLGEPAVRTDTGELFFKKDDGSVAKVSGGGIDDGDKGDITVSNSGATFTIDDDAITTSKIAASAVNDGKLASNSVVTAKIANDAVTYAKIQNVSATNRILGRDSSGAGVIEEITPANLRTMINVEDGATADQSASEIKTAYESNSDTNAFTDALLSKLNGIAASATNVTNNNQLTNGAGYITATLTNEQVQDIVGGMVSGNTETGINVVYDDGNGILDFVVASQTDNNFTTTLKNKLDGIASGATNVTNTNQLTNGAGFITSADGGNAASSDTIDVSGKNDNVTYYPTFVNNSGSGKDLHIDNGGSLNYNPSTNVLTAGTFSGTHSGNGSALTSINAATLDGIDSSQFLRSDASDTLSEVLTLSKDTTDVVNFSANSTNDNRGIAFNGRTAISADYNDGFLRINNASEFSNGVYTPTVLRADGGFQVNANTVINSSGNLIASRLTGALPAIDGSSLTGISAGATGGGSDEVFYENDQTVTTNYTITNGKNAMAAGPITINSGVTVTVGSGETLTIV